MASLRYWMWLASETTVSPDAKFALIRHYGDPERAFRAPKGEYAKIPDVTAGNAKKLERHDMSRVDDILAACDGLGLSILTYNDDRYPIKLKNIEFPPVVLFVRGRLPDADNNAVVALIGTREPTPYGVKAAVKIGSELSEGGALLVNGLTQGIEREAALAQLRAGGQCIGVLGTGHDKPLSPDYEQFSESIVTLSEYPPGVKAMRSFFKDRNRITAGLSDAVAAIEAPAVSGTLGFMETAAEQGKMLFAVPGSILSAESEGTNLLIKHGARLITCAWDVLSELDALYPGKLREVSGKHRYIETPETEETETEETAPVIKIRKPAKEKEDKEDKEDKVNKEDVSWQEKLKLLSAEQLHIINALISEAKTPDEIVAATGLGIAKVLGQLTILEIKGYVRRGANRTLILNVSKK